MHELIIAAFSRYFYDLPTGGATRSAPHFDAGSYSHAIIISRCHRLLPARRRSADGRENAHEEKRSALFHLRLGRQGVSRARRRSKRAASMMPPMIVFKDLMRGGRGRYSPIRPPPARVGNFDARFSAMRSISLVASDGGWRCTHMGDFPAEHSARRHAYFLDILMIASICILFTYKKYDTTS